MLSLLASANRILAVSLPSVCIRYSCARALIFFTVGKANNPFIFFSKSVSNFLSKFFFFLGVWFTDFFSSTTLKLFWFYSSNFFIINSISLRGRMNLFFSLLILSAMGSSYLSFRKELTLFLSTFRCFGTSLLGSRGKE